MNLVSAIFLISVTILLLVSPSVNAEYVAAQKETLRVIQSIHVVMEFLTPEAKRFGLIRNNIITDIESKLHMAGIKVVPQEERFTIPGSPYLYVNINTTYSPSGLFACTIIVELNQIVYLDRDQNLSCPATTWNKEITSIGRGKEMEMGVRNSLKDLINEFTNDYLEVNLKQTSKSQGGV